MITCSRCGTSNEEDARFCLFCGHKLQSGRVVSDDEGLPAPVELTPGLGGDGTWFRKLLLRCVEVWGVVLVLGGAVVYGLFTRTWWPALAAGGLAAVLVSLRRT